MKITFSLLLFGFTLLLGCDSIPKPAEVQDFDIDLLRSECSNVEGNVIISPFSVSNVTKMILAGATGETEGELLKAYNSSNKDGLLQENKDVMSHLASLERARMICVNAFYYDKNGIELTSNFKDVLGKYFSAEEKSLDFANKDSTLDEINGWCNTNTLGRIPTILDDISEDEVMFLLNAIYLKASWASPFDSDLTRNGDFILSNGNTVTASYMHQDVSVKFSTYGKGEMIELEYQNKEMSLFLIRPISGSLDEYISDFYQSTFDSLFENRQNKLTYHLSIPKFTVEYKNENMKPTFESMGVRKMFTPAADMNLSNTSKTYITRIVHKTYFMIDEEGTEGAAVTAGGVGITSVPPAFRLNQPFMFALRHNATGQMLFMGRVNNPAE